MARHPAAERLAVGVLAPDDAHDLAVMNDGDAVRVAEEIVELFGDPDDTGPFGRLPKHFAINGLGRQHVEPHCRIAGDHQIDFAGQLARDDELLQVAAREEAASAGCGGRTSWAAISPRARSTIASRLGKNEKRRASRSARLRARSSSATTALSSGRSGM